MVPIYIKNIDKHVNYNYLSNAHKSICDIIYFLNQIGIEISDYGHGKQIKKSPYSNSLYLELWQINNHSITFTIRVSNHLPNNFPEDCILNIYSETGRFYLTKNRRLEILKETIS